MFWGLVLKANKRYSHVVSKAFHVSHATLDVHTFTGSEEDVVQVWLTTDDNNHLLCNLGKSQSHVPLDLAFSEGESIAFFSKGQGIVHLTGFLIPEEPDFGPGFDGLEEGEEEEDVSDEEQQPSKANKSKAKVAQNGTQESDEDDSDEDDFELGDDDDLDDLEEEEDDDDDEDDDEEDDDEDDDEEEAAPEPPKKVAKLEKSGKPKENAAVNGKPQSKDQSKKEKQKSAVKPQQPQQQPQQNQQPKSKVLQHGVKVEDLRVGKGPEAKPGKKVQVYYEGRLQKTNKVFDSSKGGEGFKFTLGQGQVIKGWDVGVVGMKVGSKRRITCPPHAAYGQKGSPPVIPPNSTLVFDVELRGVQ